MKVINKEMDEFRKKIYEVTRVFPACDRWIVKDNIEIYSGQIKRWTRITVMRKDGKDFYFKRDNDISDAVRADDIDSIDWVKESDISMFNPITF